jgi:hypothetical protein
MDQQGSAGAMVLPPAQPLGVSWRLGVSALLPPRMHAAIPAPAMTQRRANSQRPMRQ